MIKDASLTPTIISIVRDKNTEPPGTGAYNDFAESGSYLCRRCGLALFHSNTKFEAACGWPSFDEMISGAVVEQPDSDGRRTEILCARCQAHLGHVFRGEAFTQNNTRYCVNSLSLDFVVDPLVNDTEETIVAGGCFWGVEHLFKKLTGVLKTEVGYTGGHQRNPIYDAVCAGVTGHVEAVRILYDPKKINYESVIRYFFEIHDPFQHGGQGHDMGAQYVSVVFYYNETQQRVIQQLIDELEKKYQRSIATTVKPVTPFWPAEKYHQQYYEKKKQVPYCHRYVKRFDL